MRWSVIRERHTNVTGKTIVKIGWRVNLPNRSTLAVFRCAVVTVRVNIVAVVSPRATCTV